MTQLWYKLVLHRVVLLSHHVLSATVVLSGNRALLHCSLLTSYLTVF